MKTLLSLFFFIFCCTISFSQHAKVTISEDFKISGKGHKEQTVDHAVFHDGFFYTVTNSGIGKSYKWLFTKLYDLKYSVTISKYDKNMNLISEFEPENGANSFGPLYPELVLLNNKLMLGYFKANDKSSFSLYFAPVDQKTLSLGTAQKLHTFAQDNAGIMKLTSMVTDQLATFTNSPDNSKMLVVVKSNTDLVKTIVFDNNLKMITQTDYKTKTSDYFLSTSILTNEGFEAVILFTANGKKILCRNAGGKKEEIELADTDNMAHYATDLVPARDGKNVYVISSGRLLGETDKGCKGLILSKLDVTSLALSAPVEYQFSPEQIQLVHDNGGGKKIKKELMVRNFSPNLIELENGKLAVLVCPAETEYKTHTRTNGRESTTVTDHVGPIVACFLDKSGNTLNLACIPRNIETSMPGEGASAMALTGGSIRSYKSAIDTRPFYLFTAARRGNEIVIIYNDSEANLSSTAKVKEASSPGDLVLVEAVFGADQKLLYRKPIGESQGKGYSYHLDMVIETSASSVIFPVAKGGLGFNVRKMLYSNMCFLDIN